MQDEEILILSLERRDAAETLRLQVGKAEVERLNFNNRITQLENEVKGLGILLDETKKKQLQKIDDETSRRRSTLDLSMEGSGSDLIKEPVVMVPNRLKVLQ